MFEIYDNKTGKTVATINSKDFSIKVKEECLPDWIEKSTIYYVKDNKISECNIVYNSEKDEVTVHSFWRSHDKVPSTISSSDIGNSFFWYLGNAIAVAKFR